jgi:hypothetical protein
VADDPVDFSLDDDDSGTEVKIEAFLFSRQR